MIAESKQEPRRLLGIVGPTASGKSSCGMTLAKHFRGEILSCDMLQVFRGFDIGSAKVRHEEQQGIAHHLLDICNPDERYDAARFRHDALECLHVLWKKSPSVLPILVGGANFYLESLLCGIDEIPANDPELREKFCGLSSSELYEELLAKDPQRAAQLHPHDRMRVERALQMIHATGKQSQELFREKNFFDRQLPPTLLIVLCWERKLLYERIEKRVQNMFAAGLAEEAHALAAQWGDHVQGFDAIGYRQVLEGGQRGASREEIQALVAQKTRQYAKRQYTYWRNAPKKFSWLLRPQAREKEDVVFRGGSLPGEKPGASQQVQAFRCLSWDFQRLIYELEQLWQGDAWQGVQVWYLDAAPLLKLQA